MSTIKGLVLNNWLRFKGQHTLNLQPKAYAVIAQYEADKDRSNYLGKTALIEAVRFALYGEHRFRTADEWITKGEKEGGVTLMLDDGFCIHRTRERGKSTRLTAGIADNLTRKLATQEEAQVLIERHLGMTLRDFDASAYFDPSNIASRMVIAKPEDRMKIIEAWLELEPLKKAEEFNANRLRLCAAEVDGLAQRLINISARRTEFRTAEEIQILIAAQEQRVIEYTAKMKEADQSVKDAQIFQRVLLTKRDYDQVVAQAKTLQASKKPAEGDLDAAQKAYEAALTASNEAGREERSKRLTAAGEFDGVCPVAGIQCPAREEINGRRVESAAAHVEASRRSNEAKTKFAEVSNAYSAIRSDHQRAKNEEWQLSELLKRAHILAESLEKGPQSAMDVDSAIKNRMQIWEQKTEAIRVLQALHTGLEQVDKDEREEARLKAMMESIESVELTAFREAALILGPRGAQRAVAEPFLQAIEQGANEALTECGVDLSVVIQWEHEGKEAAKTCSACGHPFPASVRVKTCPKCGAERGKNIINRLDFEFSNRSKGAEDMWGVAVQLAATAWLRAGRDVSFETSFFDEPWAHLDKTHRRALTRAFVSMLGRFGIRQAFAISHSPDMAAFPGIITITGKRDGTSTVEVTS